MTRLYRAVRRWDGGLNSRSGRELIMLRGLSREAAEMRRASHSAARLELEREHLELEKRSQEEFRRSQFDQWLATPEAQARALDQRKRERWKHNQIRRIFGQEPLPEDEGDGRNGISLEAQNELRATLGMEPLEAAPSRQEKGEV